MLVLYSLGILIRPSSSMFSPLGYTSKDYTYFRNSPTLPPELSQVKTKFKEQTAEPKENVTEAFRDFGVEAETADELQESIAAYADWHQLDDVGLLGLEERMKRE